MQNNNSLNKNVETSPKSDNVSKNKKYKYNKISYTNIERTAIIFKYTQSTSNKKGKRR